MNAKKKPAARKRKPKARAEKNKGGRPSTFSTKIVDAICERLCTGEPLAQICRDETMPCLVTVWNWQKARPDVSERLARAREAGYDQIALDALRISDDGTRDYVNTEDGFAVDHDHIQRSKLRVDTRLKLLKVWDPKRYGDRQALEHSGPGGGPIPVATIDATKLSDGALQELLNVRRAAADGG